MRTTSQWHEQRAELVALLGQRTFKRGRFQLVSGRSSRIYFDMKATMMHPKGALLCAEGLLATLDGLNPHYIGGLEMGAVPLLGAVAALSEQRGRPVAAIFIRKAAKGHGTRAMVEGLAAANGESLAGKRVVLIDDVATSGGSVLQAAEQVRMADGIVNDAIVILDREEGAEAMLAASGIRLHSLATASDLGVTDEDRRPLND